MLRSVSLLYNCVYLLKISEESEVSWYFGYNFFVHRMPTFKNNISSLCSFKMGRVK